MIGVPPRPGVELELPGAVTTLDHTGSPVGGSMFRQMKSAAVGGTIWPSRGTVRAKKKSPTIPFRGKTLRTSPKIPRNGTRRNCGEFFRLTSWVGPAPTFTTSRLNPELNTLPGLPRAGIEQQSGGKLNAPGRRGTEKLDPHRQSTGGPEGRRHPFYCGNLPTASDTRQKVLGRGPPWLRR